MKALAMTPVDVRLMHSLASALMLGVLAFALYALASWVARLPLFALSGITITGEVQHTNSVTLKANVTPKLSGSFFTVDLQQTRQFSSSCPGCGGRWSSVRSPTACGSTSRSTSRWLIGGRPGTND